MKFNSNTERQQFITNNIKLVSSRVLNLNKGIYDDDLFQAGCVGLVYAVDRFDESRGCLFSSYAVRYIDGYIQKCKNYNSLIKPKKCKSESGTFQYKNICSIDFANMIQANDDPARDAVENVFVKGFMKCLKEREKQVLSLALLGNMQTEISKIMGITKSYVSRILKDIARKYKIISCDIEGIR